MYMRALMKHLTKLKKIPKYSEWNSLGSKAIQDITQRIDKGYKLFFRNREYVKNGLLLLAPIIK